mgnify:CR=1 FL=1
MGVELLLGLLGGLALFLYGMQMMSNNLEAAAGNKMKQILEKLTTNRFMGILVGAGITALIQSSSATTVMTVGFVNSGLMSLNQAVWIIMGANIGTTITGQLIALDVGALAPLIAFIGVVLVVFVKNKKLQHIGGIVAGVGVIFIGMGMMSDAMLPLRDEPEFIQLMTSFKNPLLGVMAAVHSSDPVFRSFYRYLTGTGCKRRDRSSQRCVRTVRSEYRYLYHGCSGFCGNQQKCKTYYSHPSDVQRSRYSYLCGTVYGNTIRRLDDYH